MPYGKTDSATNDLSVARTTVLNALGEIIRSPHSTSCHHVDGVFAGLHWPERFARNKRFNTPVSLICSLGSRSV